MSKNHYTCLVYREREDGSKKLVNVPVQEWMKRVKEDRDKPSDERRYYATSYCERERDDDLDCLIVEVTLEEHRVWNAANTRHSRDFIKAKKGWRLVSLDAPVPGADGVTFGDVIPDTRRDMREETETAAFLEAVREELAEWKPWASDMLALSQRGYFDDEDALAGFFGVSTRQIRTRKRQFRDHVRTLARKWLNDGDFHNSDE